MSIVTGIVIICTVGEDTSDGDAPPVLFDRLNDWIEARGKGRPLVPVEDAFGGGKHPQLHCAGAGINYFDAEEFVEFAMSLPWRAPENVVLVMQPDSGQTRVFRPA